MRKLILLLWLSGLGTGCAFAALGVTVFARVPDVAVFGWVYFAFGAAAGLCCTLLRLGMAHVAAQGAAAAVPAALPQAAPVPAPAAMPAARPAEPRPVPAAGFASSAFGAL